MRLFVAIVLPDVAIAELATAVEPLRLAAPGLRWAAQQNWHLTLAFLGEVSEPKLPELRTRLERAARRHPPQRLALQGGGAFPSRSRARVLWAGLDADRQALGRLAASVAAGARRAGAVPPDAGRSYHPHVTLARSAAPADLSGLVAGLRTFSGTAWTAGAVELIRSHLGAGAPRYESAGGWPLAAAPSGGAGAGGRRRPGAPEGERRA